MNSQNNKTQPGKKSYRAPSLTLYGAVKELTKGGTKGEAEGKAITNLNKRA